MSAPNHYHLDLSSRDSPPGIPFGYRLSIRSLVLSCLLTTGCLAWLWTWYDIRPNSISPVLPSPLRSASPVVSPVDVQTLVWEKRKNQVQEAYRYAMSGYEKYAFPADELRAMTGTSSNKLNGWAVTLVDSLDTMWIMGLREMFANGIRHVAGQNFIMEDYSYAPFFETTIRYLGGLLSAYALSGETILLSRADDLGRMLLPVFNATSSGLPDYSVNPQTGKTTATNSLAHVAWAEATSCQLEYKYLAKLTGRVEYYENVTQVERVMSVMYAANVSNGLFPTLWNYDGTPNNSYYSVGAQADSGYEYLLKQWLLSGDSRARDQYIKSIDGILNKLFYVTPHRKLVYVTDVEDSRPSNNFEHLSCFLAGVLALGAHTLGLPSKTKELHQWAAQGLAYTCWMTYADQKTGLGPERMSMVNGGRWMDHIQRWEDRGKTGVPPGLGEGPTKGRGERDYNITDPMYLLRPETIESFYMLWKTTGDVRWRERGYAIFQAIEKFAKTKYGYASVGSVDEFPWSRYDDMPSYFLAETLKYLYLLFDDSDPISLDKWVFNTEAHPLPVFSWRDWEKQAYHIL